MAPRRSLEPLRTGADAIDRVRTLLEQRLEAAEQRADAAPNEPLPGDAAARSAFYTLLSPVQQRALFLEVASRPSA